MRAGWPGAPRGTRRAMNAPDTPAGVLFDVDGTLVDTTYLHAVSWWRALKEHGHRVPMAVIHRAVGMGSDHLLEHVLGAGRDPAGDDALVEAHGRYYRPYLEQVVPLPGAAALLRACAARNLRVVLASSAKGDELAVLRRSVGADDVVTAATSAEDVTSTKPAPDLVEVALDKAGLAAGRALFVGDSVWDVRAAGRLGIPCVGLTSGGTSVAELEDAGAVAVYADPAELLACVDASPVSWLAGGAG